MKARSRPALFWAGLLISGVCSACTSGRAAVYSYEVTSADKLAMNVVDETQPTFVVLYEAEHYSSDRMGYFFKTILNSSLHSGTPNTVTGETIQTGGSENYIYTIRKVPRSDGMSYTVTCIARSSGQRSLVSDRNAKSLARFLQFGILEKQALVR